VSFITSSENVQFARTPHPKETVCGDDGAAWDDRQYTWLVVSDGLGHGPGAAEASQAALEWIINNHTEDIDATLRGCDRAIRHTRGISLNLVKIDRDNHTAKYVSIGANLGWKVQRSGTRRLAGGPGVVGSGISKFYTLDIPLEGSGFLILASDGINKSSDVSQLYTAPSSGDRSIAESIIDEWNTGTDDASVMVYRFLS
jgi:serine/threonine protein phosphatase PrpC